MAAAFNKFNAFAGELPQGAVNLGTDVLKVMLTNTVPTPSEAVYGDVSATELASGNGYTTGGAAASLVSSSQSGGIYRLVLNPVKFIAAGVMGPFRYAIFYSLNTSIVAKPLIGWWDNGAPVTLNEGSSFTVAFDATLGVLSIQ